MKGRTGMVSPAPQNFKANIAFNVPVSNNYHERGTTELLLQAQDKLQKIAFIPQALEKEPVWDQQFLSPCKYTLTTKIAATLI